MEREGHDHRGRGLQPRIDVVGAPPRCRPSAPAGPGRTRIDCRRRPPGPCPRRPSRSVPPAARKAPGRWSCRVGRETPASSGSTASSSSRRVAWRLRLALRLEGDRGSPPARPAAATACFGAAAPAPATRCRSPEDSSVRRGAGSGIWLTGVIPTLAPPSDVRISPQLSRPSTNQALKRERQNHGCRAARPSRVTASSATPAAPRMSTWAVT